MKGEGSIRITGDYFLCDSATTNRESVNSVGLREKIEGKEYWGDRMRKGIYKDDILKSADFDFQYLTRYDEIDNSHYFILNTKMPTELIVEGITEDRCVIFDMAHGREYVQNRKVFAAGNYKIKIYSNEDN
jgi:hypothetical protein